MQISKALFERMVNLFASNNSLLDVDAGAQVKIEPVNISFSSGLNTVLADVPAQSTLMTVAANVEADESHQEYTDAITQERVVVWGWDVNPGIFIRINAGAAFTIHGMRLVSFDDATLLATELLPSPEALSSVGQGFEVHAIQFRFPPSMVR